MNKFRALLLGLMLSCTIGSQISANAPANDYSFEQDRMMLTQDSVILLSTFDYQDMVTAYSYYGTRLWNKEFHAKILSWKIAGDLVFVFSKDRHGNSTYITCLDRRTGDKIWQKP